MSMRISEIDPKTVEDYLLKYKHSLALMDEAVRMGTSLHQLATMNPSKMMTSYVHLNTAFTEYIAAAREYRDQQKKALLDFVKGKTE